MLNGQIAGFVETINKIPLSMVALVALSWVIFLCALPHQPLWLNLILGPAVGVLGWQVVAERFRELKRGSRSANG